MIGSHGQVITVSEKEIADSKAMIGRDGIGCEPASATTLAGIRNLVGAGFIRCDESVVAVLTGHLLKDPDYVSQYHRGTLSLGPDTKDRKTGSLPNIGAFRNAPVEVAASKNAILDQLRRANS